ncbi:hypothetical protein DRJ17_00880 [Candidatus Woesearchaeota archaeon]|nr:MAG: hypothetical protein DRJ17_00880 [Candidatus Woesearchaeota archaeon]
MARNSPTSIIIYNQCPRLYYHIYKEKREARPNIIFIKGNVVHKALESFFSEEPPLFEKNYQFWAAKTLKKMFMRAWNGKKNEIAKLRMSKEELKEHYEECWDMLNHWLQDFLKRIEQTGDNFQSAFNKLKPITEDECYLEEYDTKGFIDAIENVNGEIRIIDYKTSSKFEITKEYKLQLAIYALLYEKKYGRKPDKVGIYFLKERLHLISVDDAMLKYAEEQCKKVFEKTKSDDIKDYPQNEGYLCKQLKEKCPCHEYEQETEDS